jgi:hypothetical protein
VRDARADGMGEGAGLIMIVDGAEVKRAIREVWWELS